MTGVFLDAFATGGGLSEPTGLVFGPDGNLYVAGSISNVSRFDGTTGQFLEKFVPEFSGGLVNPNDLVFGLDGNLGSGAFTGRVLRYNAGLAGLALARRRRQRPTRSVPLHRPGLSAAPGPLYRPLRPGDSRAGILGRR